MNMTDAQYCAENGWGVGTVLEAPRWDGVPSRIRITAIGEEVVVVRVIVGRGTRNANERIWRLVGRLLWREVPA